MSRLSCDQLIVSGFSVAAVGLGLCFGGIASGPFGNRAALDIALAGTVTTAAASVPLRAARLEMQREHFRRVDQLRHQLGA